MTTLLEPEIIRAGGKPPPGSYEGDSPGPRPDEADEAEETEETKEKG